jgi:hypothetical protein
VPVAVNDELLFPADTNSKLGKPIEKPLLIQGRKNVLLPLPSGAMTIQRMDHMSIVVDGLAAATAFF